jgi:hypothetical protein
MAEVVMVVVCNLEMPSFNFGQVNDYPKSFYGLPRSLQANVGIVLITSFYILSNSLFAIIQSFHTTQPELLTASLNKIQIK